MTQQKSSDLTELHIEGMHCGHCTQTVRKALADLGVTDVTIDINSSSALLNSGTLPIERIISALNKAGYPTRLHSEGAAKKSPFIFSLEAKLLISAVFTLPLMAHMVVDAPIFHNHFLQALLAAPVVCIGLTHFGKGAWRALKQRIANMDLLIFIGIASAFFYSLYGAVRGLGENFLFYETAASITLFVLFGSYLERQSMKRTSAAVEELARLQPDSANRIKPDGTVEKIPSSSVHAGDLLLLRNGEKVPVDCEITEGTVSVNESFVTGESLPVTRKEGEKLIGGSVLVDGSAHARASAVGEETVLSQIIRLVKTATSQKPAIEKLGDMVSGVFVPVVLTVAVTTFLGGHLLFSLPFEQALLQAIAVLVVACPCAMGLATPTAVTVGIGRATGEGALIKGGAALERLAHVDTVIFDKTGTLTTGELKVDDIKVSANRGEALNIIRSLEVHSTHPLAQTIIAALPAGEPVSFKSVVEEKGLGIRATDEKNTEYLLGSAKFTKQDQTEGDIFLIKDGTCVASLTISDTIKPDARDMISELRRIGISVVLISGDHRQKVAAAANTLGIDRYYAEQMPDQKLTLTKELSQGHRACFVGDGINDAPALAQASVGVSLSGATQVAIQTAEVILLDGKLSRLPALISLSRVTFKTIKENLFWAFFYNSLAIPFAAFGFLTPLVAALTMAFSDVIVIGNSLRLKVRDIGYTPRSLNFRFF